MQTTPRHRGTEQTHRTAIDYLHKLLTGDVRPGSGRRAAS